MNAMQGRTFLGRNRFAASSAVFLLGAAALAGCGEDEPGADVDATPSVSASPSQTPTPSESTSPTAPSASASTTPDALPPGAGLRERLLPAALLPGFNEDWTWQVGSTEPAGSEPFGTCARFDMLSIGAREGVQRTYTEAGAPKSDTVAAMQVYDFADAKTVQRATAVLRSWHDSCRERSSDEVGPIESVDVPDGKGTWYLVTSPEGAREEGHFHAFGVASVGSRMALITMDNDGQDRIYEPGQDPMELAVAAAAARLS